MSETITLTSRRVLLDGAFRPASVVVRHGRIAAIDAREGEILDLGDDALLPALTDCHVHINEPGRTEWEGFETATKAAAAGGVTLIVDMPLNSDPVTTTRAALDAKKASAAGKLWVDVGLWGGVVPGNAGELRAMVDGGALGFKCFTCHSGIDDFPASTAEDLRIAMPVLRACGVPLLVHAELESPIEVTGDPREYATYLHSRPKEWEDRAVAMIVELVRETGCRAHIVHLSSAGALAAIRAAKADGLPITAETCPHYLGLAADEVPPGATEYKCAPPIRDRANQDLLWAALLDGTLDFVVTDHSPCIPALKRFETGQFMDAWGGVASLQLGLRSVWTAAHGRGVPLETVVRWMSASTAAFTGRSDRGAIRVGANADLVRFRPDTTAVLDPATLHHRHPTTPWAGRVLRGDVVTTWQRGERIAHEGRVDGPPRGRIHAAGSTGHE